MEATVKLYSYSFANAKAYLLAAIFVAGNILLPQLIHFVPQGGPMLLPIFFFTLVAAYKYGIGVGLLTAVLSPLTSHLLFGMPAAGMLAPILIKSVTLAVAAALAARYAGKVSFLAILAAIVAYQLIGTAGEWLIAGDLKPAVQALHTGIPGMLLQLVGGYAVLRAIARI